MDLALFVTVNDSPKSGCEICMWFNIVEFAGLNQRGDDCSVFGTYLMACKESIFSVEGYRADGALDSVVIHLDATIAQKLAETLPVFGSVFEGLTQERFSRQTHKETRNRKLPTKGYVGSRHRLLFHIIELTFPQTSVTS